MIEHSGQIKILRESADNEITKLEKHLQNLRRALADTTKTRQHYDDELNLADKLSIQIGRETGRARLQQQWLNEEWNTRKEIEKAKKAIATLKNYSVIFVDTICSREISGYDILVNITNLASQVKEICERVEEAEAKEERLCFKREALDRALEDVKPILPALMANCVISGKISLGLSTNFYMVLAKTTSTKQEQCLELIATLRQAMQKAIEDCETIKQALQAEYLEA